MVSVVTWMGSRIMFEERIGVEFQQSALGGGGGS
jgi:hypothetical protein